MTHPLINLLQNFLDTKKVGSISFKGIVQIGRHDIPIETEINMFKGGIRNVNVRETIEVDLLEEYLR